MKNLNEAMKSLKEKSSLKAIDRKAKEIYDNNKEYFKDCVKSKEYKGPSNFGIRNKSKFGSDYNIIDEMDAISIAVKVYELAYKDIIKTEGTPTNLGDIINIDTDKKEITYPNQDKNDPRKPSDITKDELLNSNKDLSSIKTKIDGDINTGDKFENGLGGKVTILEPTKSGEMQYEIGSEQYKHLGSHIYGGTQDSIRKTLQDNGYKRVTEGTEHNPEVGDEFINKEGAKIRIVSVEPAQFKIINTKTGKEGDVLTVDNAGTIARILLDNGYKKANSLEEEIDPDKENVKDIIDNQVDMNTEVTRETVRGLLDSGAIDDYEYYSSLPEEEKEKLVDYWYKHYDDDLVEKKEKSLNENWNLSNVAWSNMEEYTDEQAAEILKILNGLDLEVTDCKKQGDGWSVAIKDKTTGMVFWLDYTDYGKDDVGIIGDWNQYIFSRSNSDDMIRQAIQTSYNRNTGEAIALDEFEGLGNQYIMENSLDESKALNEEVTAGNIKQKAMEVLPAEDIDVHEGDLYLKVSDASTKLVNQMKDKDSGLLTKFRSEKDGEMWYEIPFANWGDNLTEAVEGIKGLPSNAQDVTSEFKNIQAFENNFEKIRIIKSNNHYWIYRSDAKEDSDYINHVDNRDYIEGWLYGAVQAANKVIK